MITTIDRLDHFPILKFKLSDDIFSKIKQDAFNSLEKNKDVGVSLVGEIINGKEVELFTDDTPLISIGNEYCNWFSADKTSQVSLYLSESWVVLQRAGDYNPIHMHSSFLSGIIYIQIPDVIKKQKPKTTRTQKDNPDGYITFFNGREYKQLKPEEGYGYIFASNTLHQVYPFRGDEERISISWNLELDPNKTTNINFKF